MLRSAAFFSSKLRARAQPKPPAAVPVIAVNIEARVTEVDRRKVTFEFAVHDPVEQVGRGKHVRFVLETAKTRERLAQKRAKAGL